jgi:site-specific recombinase XerD
MKEIIVSDLIPRDKLNSIVSNAINSLESLGYKQGTIKNYQSTWNNFLQFAKENSGDGLFSTTLTYQFLESYGIASNSDARLTFQQRHIRNVMQVLTEFALHGCIQRRTYISEKIQLPDSLQKTLSLYEQFCNEQQWSPLGTIRKRKRDITKFLHYLDVHNIKVVKDIHASSITLFVASCTHLKSATLAHLVCSIRSFLRYLCMKGITNCNLVEQVPKIRVLADERIPSCWKQEDVEVLLTTVDRSSPCGKRDYAILLLAARLGMRVSDIRNLSFENLLWEKTRIEIKQAKSGEPLTLPLTKEIGQALIDYLRYGRPDSQYREIFLRANAPFKAFGHDNNLYYIITKYRRRAGITLPLQSRKGMHSLRHTVASQLLEDGVALETISSILGHLSVETTRIYTKVNITALRSVAIGPEEVDYE